MYIQAIRLGDKKLQKKKYSSNILWTHCLLAMHTTQTTTVTTAKCTWWKTVQTVLPLPIIDNNSTKSECLLSANRHLKLHHKVDVRQSIIFCPLCHASTTCYPRDVWRICPWQPVRRDTVMKTECIQSNLERAKMKCSVGSTLAVVSRRRWRLIDKHRRWTVATSFDQNRLGQLKHEVSRRLTWLVWQHWHDAILANFIPKHTSI